MMPSDETLDGVIAWAIARFGEGLTLATSLSAEDMVLLDAVDRVAPTLGVPVRAFFLDTGRMHEETYRLLDRARARYATPLDIYCPDTLAVEGLVRAQGLYGFRDSIEARQDCCRVRKLGGLGRALAGKRAWLTGLRREQSAGRSTVTLVEEDESPAGLTKVNPLYAWTWPEVEAYLAARDVPTSALYAEGYLSIGCAPCTRPVAPGQDVRAGRWWWESPDHKECGLHTRRPS